MKIEDILSPPEPEVYVMFQGDRYVSANGTNYLLTPSYEDMNSQGIVSRRRVETEPPREAFGFNAWRDRGAWSEAVPPPTPPPMPPTETARPREPPEVSSRTDPVTISFVPVIRIMIDQDYIALYRN